jgi:hypothetical protein
VSRASLFAAFTFLVVAGVGLTPVAADWLVLRDGSAVETKGAWEVRGKLVVFQRADASLASMRLTEVDLEQSQRHTAAAKLPPAKVVAEPSREVKAVLVLTDADVRHIDPADLVARGDNDEEERDGEESAESEAPGEVSGERDGRAEAEGAVRVTGWHTISDVDFAGVKIGGAVQNDSDSVALNIALTVRLTDENGQTIGTSQANLRQKALGPGTSTIFEAEFSGIYTFVGTDFELQSFDAVRNRN